MAVTASEARKNLFPLIAKVNEERQPVEITSKGGDAVLMSRSNGSCSGVPPVDRDGSREGGLGRVSDSLVLAHLAGFIE